HSRPRPLNSARSKAQVARWSCRSLNSGRWVRFNTAILDTSRNHDDHAETCITKGRDQTYNPLGGYGMTTVLAGKNKPDIKTGDAPPFPWGRPVAEDGSN